MPLAGKSRASPLSSQSSAVHATRTVSVTHTAVEQPQQTQYNSAFPTFDPSLAQPFPSTEPYTHQSASLSPPTAASTASSSTTSLLGVTNGSHPSLSRESRITLPDEARQYITNMVPSPGPSPQVASFTPTNPFSTDPATPTQPTIPNARPPKDEFLELDDDGVEDDEDEGSIDQETAENGTIASSSYSDISASNLSSQTAVDEFPLPPSDPSVTAHPMQAGYQNGYAVAPPRAASLPSTSDVNPKPGTYVGDSLSSTQYAGVAVSESPQKRGGGSQNVPFSGAEMSTVPKSVPFRALPLLSSDLPHASVVVANSYVRPNDRGKEIMSFVIQVNPGSGKESWKVEKSYSDVLGLDQRVRASVSRSVIKKIASLPEGKVWRDHAPAKVDQRKVQPLLQCVLYDI